jgi:RimJ/RimL family protein N-acetyltransferase
MILKEMTFNEIKKIIPEQVSDVHIEKSNKLMEILSSVVAESNGDLKCMNPLLIVEDDVEIGFLGAKNNIVAEKQAEIYYMIFSEYRGNGYMTRALKLYIEYLKSNFSEVICIKAFIENDNISSMIACKKNGFIKVGKIDENMMEWRYQFIEGI